MSESIKLIPNELKAGVFDGTGIFERGGKNVAYADYFTGTSYLELMNKPGVMVANITFEPGCRNHWLVPRRGQTCTRIVCRRCDIHCTRTQALAWSSERQLVCSRRS
jgi:hypothetical protein